MTIETTVAISPAPTPISSVARALSTVWAKTSCPISVVPSQWLRDGAATLDRPRWFGSVRKNGPKIASSTKNPTMPVPATSLGDRKAARSLPVRRPGSSPPVSAATAATTLVALTGTASSAGR